MNKFHALTLLFSLVFFIGCGSNKRDGLANYVGRYLENNNRATIIMKLDLAEILNKVALRDIPDFGEQFGGTLDQLEKGATLSQRVFLVGEGPILSNNMPEDVLLFLAVEDEVELAIMLNEMGYFFEKEGGLEMHEEMDMCMAYKDDLLIAVLSENNPKEKLQNAFKKAQSGKVNDELMSFLDREGDILLTLHLENLYATANTELNRLPVQQQEKFKRLTKGSFVTTSIQFNKGEMVVETNLDFNDELANAMFLGASGNSNALAKIGPGEPILVAAMNLDIPKMDEMLLSDYPEILKQMYSKMGPQGLILKTMGGGKLASFVNGEFALAITGVMDNDGKEEPIMNFYTGLGKASGDLAEVIALFAEEKDAEKLGEGIFRHEGYLIKMTREGITMSSDPDMTAEKMGSNALSLSPEMQKILSNPVAFYIDFDALAGSDADQILGDAEIAVNYIDYVSFTADNKKARLVIKFISDEKNFLKQSVDIALEAMFP
jgi:hypothetical protein